MNALKSIALRGIDGTLDQPVEANMPSARNTFPSQERLREMLRYDAATGQFFWRVQVANVSAGSVAGRVVANGYRAIRLDGVEHYAHHLAWLYVHGEVPPKYLRFRDKVRSNCRIENIYHVSDPRGNTALYWRERNLQRRFGITVEEYTAKLLEQSGVCAICHRPETDTRGGKVKNLAVDHDHKTGDVRALLCVACNTAIGKMDDSAARLRAAADYLDRHAAAAKAKAEADAASNVVPIRSA
jgi:hypothetical protein